MEKAWIKFTIQSVNIRDSSKDNTRKRRLGIVFLLLPLIVLVSCGGSGLKGKYVNVWSYHQENDVQPSYDFKRNGIVVQELNIKPYDKLNFKGVHYTIEGKWEMEDSNIIITIPKGSYEM